MAVDKSRGARIKALLKEKGLKHGDLAEKCSVSVRTVDKWVGGHTLTDHVILKLCSHLGCSADYLLTGTKYSEPSRFDRIIETMSVHERELLLAFLRAMTIRK